MATAMSTNYHITPEQQSYLRAQTNRALFPSYAMPQQQPQPPAEEPPTEEQRRRRFEQLERRRRESVTTGDF